MSRHNLLQRLACFFRNTDGRLTSMRVRTLLQRQQRSWSWSMLSTCLVKSWTKVDLNNLLALPSVVQGHRTIKVQNRLNVRKVLERCSLMQTFLLAHSVHSENVLQLVLAVRYGNQCFNKVMKQETVRITVYLRRYATASCCPLSCCWFSEKRVDTTKAYWEKCACWVSDEWRWDDRLLIQIL